jgi:fatty-acyl-CoA synthase
MLGRMMEMPLTLRHFVERAGALFADQEVVSRRPDGSLGRASVGAMLERCQRLAAALTRLGVRAGDRVATLSWNHQVHLEAYLAVPCMGAVVHTLNLRLHPSELGYIATHAEDKVVIVDRSLLPLFNQFAPNVRSIAHVLVYNDDGGDPGAGHLDYEAALAAEAPGFAWPALDERAAAMICYTSGTTGNPKGVVYSHRSTVLHSMAVCMTDVLGVRERDVILTVVPMFHAGAWGLPYAAMLAGARLVFPGPKLDPLSLLELMQAERVTLAAGVPTIWLGMLALLDQPENRGRWDLSALRRTIVGGAAAPPAMIDGFARRHGIDVLHAWGMTEMNPLGTVATVKRKLDGASDAAVLAARASQGLPVPMVDVRHVGPDGSILPRDGATMGELEVRGPWVAQSYLGAEGEDRFTADGWFKTGDVVTIDGDGYVRITDRAKDVIKSGGEWVSSVAVENALMSHPAVLEAAVFAGEHEKWGERPIAAVVFKAGHEATPEELRAFLAERMSKLWVPDAFVVLAQIPRTSTGKFLKTKLRAEHGKMLLGRT